LALFVVICGALLTLGGAYSLLMGFDVVMTERGAAMAIGGTVALAGGVIAIGIGGVLLRLSQILRSLEQRPVKTKVAVPDRPVVPIKDDAAPAAPAVEPPPSPTPAPVTTPAVGSLAGGAAAVAAGLGGAAVLTRSAAAQEPAFPDLRDSDLIAKAIDKIDLPSPPEPPEVPQFDVPAAEKEATIAAPEPDVILEALKADIAPPVAKQPDLEDELARALAEFDAPPAAPPLEDVVDLPPLKSVRRKKSWASSKEVVDLAQPPPESAVYEPADNAPAMEEADPGPEIKPAEKVDPSDQVSEEEEVTVGEQAVVVEEPVAPVDAPNQPKVLGTYNVGGRTYSMFADGSVQAMTEFGVERFASMEELRKHLAKT
jgi:hypothetical protein